MAEMEQKHIVRGVAAGLLGGLVASWMMNQFMAGPGPALRHALQSDARNAAETQAAKQSDANSGEDATMKTAEAIYHAATGGAHLSWEAEQRGGPIVHYTFGALMGGLYGGLAEYIPAVRSGLGTTFGSVLFAGADLIAVPAFHLAGQSAELSASALATPLSAHLVYGVTTELVRRVMRRIL
jgi:putative membrane protein